MARLNEENELIKPITLDEIRNTIQKTGSRKAPGKSLINKECKINVPETMINNMKHIFNASLSAGIFPNSFKKAIIKFIPKPKKDHTDPLNFRPLSLLETIGKILEK